MRENKLKKEVVADFIKWTLAQCEADKIGGPKKDRDKATERLWALKILCEKADMLSVLERIEEGRIL